MISRSAIFFVLAVFAVTVLIIILAPNSPGVPRLPVYKCDHPEFSDSDYRQTALDVLYSRLDQSGSATSQEDVDAVVAKTNALRPWAAKFTDVCMRFRIENWLDFYAGQARSEYARSLAHKEPDAFEKRATQDKLRQRALRDATAIPDLEK